MKNNLLLTCLAICLAIASCKQEEKDKQPPQAPEKPQAKQYAPQFNADSAYSFIQKQLEFGPRNPGSPGHAACAGWLTSKLESYGLEVTVQKAPIKTHDGKTFTLNNIIASFNPALNNRILLCAHWDTRPIAEKDVKDKDKPIAGADDGASGVGVLLEIARQLSLTHPILGVDVVLFDLEDYGLNGGANETWGLGSQYWSQNLHKPGYTAQYGILLDMVGAKDATFPKEGYSMEFARDLTERIWKTAKRAGYAYYFIGTEVGGITDDHYWVNKFASIPTVDIVNMSPVTHGFGPHHHTHSDNLEVIDRNTLKAVGQTVLEVIYEDAAVQAQTPR